MTEKNNFIVLLFRIIPTNLLSKAFGILARIHLPKNVMQSIINWYSDKYGVKKDEYIIPKKGFKNFNDFFTRKLKENIHSIDLSDKAIVSPVDARIDQYGDINESTLIQAKGINYSIHDLIPSKTSEKFIQGTFITLYLSPGDYHRIHAPIKGKISGYFNIPGSLFPVKESMVNSLKGLFIKNERIITYIESKYGTVAVCKVGAMNVGRISLSYDDIISNKTFRTQNELFYNESKMATIKKGEELGRFNLGSTVILIFPKNSVKLSVNTNNNIRVGEKIGEWTY